MINILDIPDQYFFVWDRARHEAAINGLEFVAGLEKEDSDEKRVELEKRITPVVGFRQAERLKTAKLEEVREALQAVRERQQYLKGYLEQKFEAARQRAAAKYSDPEAFGKQEVRRDAVFYTLARSGLMIISNVLVEAEDWERVSGEIANGESLDRYLPSEIVGLTRDLLPRAILFNEQRDELKAALRSYGLGDDQLRQLDRALPDAISLDLPEQQMEQVNTMLERCVSSEADFEMEFSGLTEQLQLDQQESQELKQKLKKVVKGSAFRLAKGLDALRNGRVDEGVLLNAYKTSTIIPWYPLGYDIAGLGVMEHDVEHVHTRNSRYRATLLNYLYAMIGIPTKVIKMLSIDNVSSWTTPGAPKILDPHTQFNSEYVGKLIGYFLFGHGITYSSDVLVYRPCRKKSREQFLDMLAQLGKLQWEPSYTVSSSRDVAKRFGRESKSSTTSEVYLVPNQFLELARIGFQRLEVNEDPEMIKSALKCWLEDRSNRHMHVGIKPEYEGVIRRMAQTVGLGLSEGQDSFNKRRVYVRNPEIVGYRPATDAVV